MANEDKPTAKTFRTDPKYSKDNQFLREWLEAELTERAQAAQQPLPQGAQPSIFDALFRKPTNPEDEPIFGFLDNIFGPGGR